MNGFITTTLQDHQNITSSLNPSSSATGLFRKNKSRVNLIDQNLKSKVSRESKKDIKNIDEPSVRHRSIPIDSLSRK